MTRTELKKAIKAAVPSVSFVEADGLGTRNPRYRVECYVPFADVPALEAFAASIGRRAYWPTCSQNYAAYRCINVKGS